jgi:hypothetical protein
VKATRSDAAAGTESMTSTARFWIALIVVAGAIIIHALLPRYALTIGGQNNTIIYRFDRWTGTVDASPVNAPVAWIRIPPSAQPRNTSQ